LAGGKAQSLAPVLGDLKDIVELEVSLLIIVGELDLCLVITTVDETRRSFSPVGTRDVEALELVLGRISPEHFLVVRDGLAELGDGVLDLQAENDVVLDAERDADLELDTLLNDDGGLLGLCEVLGLLETKSVGGVDIILEDDRELVDDNTARIVLGRNVVGVDAELLEVGDHGRVVLLLLELSGEIDFRRGGRVRHVCDQKKRGGEAV